MSKRLPTPKAVTSLKHNEATRKNIPTAEYESLVQVSEKTPIRVAYARRNRDLDPQLVWRGKDDLDWSDLVVVAPPLYIQEKVHPKALIDDLLRDSRERRHEAGEIMPDLFADFNGIPKGVDRTEFYQHDQNWSNRMIIGDSLYVMASLAEREGLRNQVQCIYLDPPYGIRFNSNFQWSTTNRDLKDGSLEHITREPEQVKAFRDTWRDGVHSYLTYLRDRLTVARDLLSESGSIFVQIGDENEHRVRAVMDEVFGDANFCALITYRTLIVRTPFCIIAELARLSLQGDDRFKDALRACRIAKPPARATGLSRLLEDKCRLQTLQRIQRGPYSAKYYRSQTSLTPASWPMKQKTQTQSFHTSSPCDRPKALQTSLSS